MKYTLGPIRSIVVPLITFWAFTLSSALGATVGTGGIVVERGADAWSNTITITQDITLSVMTSGDARQLVFDEWITPVSTWKVGWLTPDTVPYSLNGILGDALRAGFLDCTGDYYGATTPNDGYIHFDPIPVSAGDTFTIKAGSWILAAKNWNPQIFGTFTGEVYLSGVVDGNASRLSPNTPAPEPSSVLLVGLGAVVLSARRRSGWRGYR